MVHIVDHPLIQVKLNIMRDERTKAKEFKENLDEIASLMTFEIFKDLKVKKLKEKIKTPLGAEVTRLKLQNRIIIAPILRAGLGMVDGVRNMIPTARIGHIGMYRDEKTHEPHSYYFKLPEVEDALVLVCDPMLATGGSAIAAVSEIKKKGYKNVRLMALVGCPQGLKNFQKAHPDVDVYIAAVDKILNKNCYILPGLGDAGDRIFGTK